MRAVVAWLDKVPDREGVKSVCYDIAFKPDGTQLVTGVGSRVLVYDAVDGDLLHSLKGHKDTVYCVAYSRDGKRFASGGADKTIIIWTSKAEGILKYSHNDAIQSLVYNPVTQQLASATSSDFGLWSPEQKSVAKHKVSSKILVLAWTNDGQYLALGHFNGHVSIRDKGGSEKVLIERNSPVWTLAWNPSRDEPYDILAAGCWDGTLSFYQLSGIQVNKDLDLGYDPCSVAYFSNGEYICIGGTDRKVTLATKEGTRLTTIAERDSWVWCVRPRPKQNYIAVGCDDGTISMYQLIFSTVHGLYQDRYAYRDFMTDVIIQHLITEQKVRIKCRDYVKKIAVYKDRLAVQLPDRVIIYELGNADSYDMHYRVNTKIQKKLECNLLVVTSQHVILCQERKLQMYNFDGLKEREWVLESVIRYIKVVGGPSGREGLLVGLKSGVVLKIFVDNQFPITLIKHATSIRCLDLSASRAKLAVVDENTNVMVYNLQNKELIFEEKNANSVAWNTELEDMFCFSGNGMLSIKTGDFPTHQQKLQGFVVGFKGSKIFCLHYVCMQTIDVPQSASLYRYVEKRDFVNAYKVACLGVTENDWRLLAMEALTGMSLEIARKAFIRVRDMRYIELLNRIEQGRKQGLDENLYTAELMAYQGKYQAAAKNYAKANAVEKSMEMFSDLRQFDQAKEWAEEYAKTKGDTSTVQELINKQAEWSEEVNDHEAAVDMYLKAKKFERAIAIIGKKAGGSASAAADPAATDSWNDKLIAVTRGLEKTDTKALQMCANIFKKTGHHQYAKETFVKLGDYKSLISLHVEKEKWDDAFVLLKTHPEHGEMVYLPYARYLSESDRFDEARVAFKNAGRPDQSLHMLEQLTHNAVIENRFNDACYYFWLLAMENLSQVQDGGDPRQNKYHVDQFYTLYEKAEIYYAYHFIYRCTDEPFRTIYPGTLFNIARVLLTKLSNKEPPLGVSMVYIVYALAKQGEALGAYKLARFAYNKLQGLRVPPQWQEQVDLSCVVIRSKPFSDKDDLLPICYRCSTTNPLLNTQGDCCINCGADFVRSYLTFEHLPLVEFQLENGIPDEEALELLDEEPASDNMFTRARPMGPRSSVDQMMAGVDNYGNGGADVLTMDEIPEDRGSMGGGGGGAQHMDDPFTQQMLVPHAPIRCGREMLRALPRGDVLVRSFPTPALRNQYFRIMDRDLPMTIAPCGHFFEQDEYEMSMLEKGHAPFCRTKPNAHGEASIADNLEANRAAAAAAAGIDGKKKTGWGVARGMHMVRGMVAGMGEEAQGGGSEYDSNIGAGGGPKRALGKAGGGRPNGAGGGMGANGAAAPPRRPPSASGRGRPAPMARPPSSQGRQPRPPSKSPVE